jgi:hypothetical protein
MNSNLNSRWLANLEIINNPTSPADRLARLLYLKLSKLDEKGEFKRLKKLPILKNWVDTFQQLLNEGHGFDSVKKMIDLHCANLHQEYWPQCYAAQTLVENLARIKAAAVRLGLIEDDLTSKQEIEQLGDTNPMVW